MTTNGTEIATETRPPLDKMPARKRAFDNRATEVEYLSHDSVLEPGEKADDFVLAPLVDKIAYGIARGLVTAVKELELHIATETRRVADAVDRRLDTFQISMQDLAAFVAEQRTTNISVRDQLEQLAISAVGLREVDARQLAELEVSRSQTRELSALLSQRIDVSTASLQEADARQLAELEAIRNQTRDLSASLTQKIDASTASLQEADARQISQLEALREETKASTTSISGRIDSAVASLQEADEKQVECLAALQNETKTLVQSLSERIENLCKELGVHQEDIASTKATLGTLYSRVDVLVERLDRQADAVRSMHTAYSQRESELGQLVDGLARLRAFPTSLPTNGL